MGSVNRVILVGNIGRDAQVRFTPGGDRAVANFSVATSEFRGGGGGERQERTEWHNVDLWGKPDRITKLGGWLLKGKQVYVEGKIQTDEYTDKDGVKRKSVKISADKVEFVGGRGGDSGGEGGGSYGGSRRDSYDGGEQAPPVDEFGADDIPF